MFENDPLTNYVVLIGEIGGNDEELASRYIMNTMTKPVFAYIAGESAPTNKRMGHAGAIIEKGVGSAKEKIQKLQEAGAIIAHHPEEIPMLICNFNGRAKLINKEEIVM
jgi:succinyl-CoA synthetase alpha subunit